ncbi:hypothetical protein OHT76_16625 [Streptomyces sp. NBC_00287]|uniref:hypothetical protein n=1 Tax=Streptomyces sp. NBC_00287 TaxID=2975702 RepID=UPI002E2B2FA1|nr:hypothetical protein [Streptomyces sp. NBC_00287]
MIDTPHISSAGARHSAAHFAGRSPARRRRRPMDAAPDWWEANHAVLARLAEHRVSWRG